MPMRTLILIGLAAFIIFMPFRSHALEFKDMAPIKFYTKTMGDWEVSCSKDAMTDTFISCSANSFTVKTDYSIPMEVSLNCTRLYNYSENIKDVPHGAIITGGSIFIVNLNNSNSYFPFQIRFDENQPIKMSNVKGASSIYCDGFRSAKKITLAYDLSNPVGGDTKTPINRALEVDLGESHEAISLMYEKFTEFNKK